MSRELRTLQGAKPQCQWESCANSATHALAECEALAWRLWFLCPRHVSTVRVVPAR